MVKLTVYLVLGWATASDSYVFPGSSRPQRTRPHPCMMQMATDEALNGNEEKLLNKWSRYVQEEKISCYVVSSIDLASLPVVNG
jgi:hypothetical protein